LVNSSS